MITPIVVPTIIFYYVFYCFFRSALLLKYATTNKIKVIPRENIYSHATYQINVSNCSGVYAPAIESGTSVVLL